MKRHLIGVLAALVMAVGARSQELQPLGVVGIGCARGIRIVEIIPDGPAEAALLDVGDILTAIDGQPVKKSAGKSELTTRKKLGDEVVVTYVRHGQSATAWLVVGAVPATIASGAGAGAQKEQQDAVTAQQESIPAANEARPVNLSDNFARAALWALKGIESDASEPVFRNGAKAGGPANLGIAAGR
jgi:membrane-associated protease RseP (regulator of RpoE activity)